MTMQGSVVRRAPSSSGLYDVLDLILDKGLVIDAYARVGLLGIEIVAIDARVVIASVDTYLRFADAASRLRLEHDKVDAPGMARAGAHAMAAKAVEGAVDTAKDAAKGAVVHGAAAAKDRVAHGVSHVADRVRSVVGADEEDR